MDNVVIGHLCGDPVLWQAERGGQPRARFTVAVNKYRKVDGDYVQRAPVFHKVVCFGWLAENVSNTLRKGMEVLAVGEWVDDTIADGSGERHVRIAMEAKAVGPGLRWATAQVNKVDRKSTRADRPLFDRATLTGTAPPDPAPTSTGAAAVPDRPAARTGSVAMAADRPPARADGVAVAADRSPTRAGAAARDWAPSLVGDPAPDRPPARTDGVAVAPDQPLTLTGRAAMAPAPSLAAAGGAGLAPDQAPTLIGGEAPDRPAARTRRAAKARDQQPTLASGVAAEPDQPPTLAVVPDPPAARDRSSPRPEPTVSAVTPRGSITPQPDPESGDSAGRRRDGMHRRPPGEPRPAVARAG